jgi:hypothetical protein
MAGLTSTKIITGGLGVNVKACEGLITTHFSLYCPPVVVPPPKIKGGGGGPYPGDAWNKVNDISNFYQPVQDYVRDPSQIQKPQKQVVLKINIGKINIERYYMVPVERADMLVKVLNLANKSRKIFNVKVNNLRRFLHNIQISIRNLRKKD